MATLKTKPTEQTAHAFIAQLVDDERRADCLTLLELMQKATGAEPVMWGASIVGFGTYHYRYESGREGDWMLIGFSPRKNDLTLYIHPGFDNDDALLKKLGKHKIGKSCLYLKRLADVDSKVLMQLLDAAVKAMAKQRIA